jgi:hypothetical protein
MAEYQPPDGFTSITVMLRRRPKKASVCAGLRYLSRAFSASVRHAPSIAAFTRAPGRQLLRGLPRRLRRRGGRQNRPPNTTPIIMPRIAFSFGFRTPFTRHRPGGKGKVMGWTASWWALGAASLVGLVSARLNARAARPASASCRGII